MATKLFYQEIPMDQIVKAEMKLDKALTSEEYKLALQCRSGSAYLTINLHNDGTVYVARRRRWNSSKQRYEYTVQLLDYYMEVISTVNYYKDGETCRRMDGYEVDPLFMVAVELIRLGRNN